MINSPLTRTLSLAAALAVSTAAATSASASAVNISGTLTGSSSASPDYTQDHVFQRYTDQIFNPRSGAVNLNGTIDFSEASNNSVIAIGLIDKDLYDMSEQGKLGDVEDDKGDGAATYQSGAYGQFGPSSGAGPTDGNFEGETVQNYTGGERSLDSDTISFSLTINPDGTLTLTENGESSNDTYGDIKLRDSYYDNFSVTDPPYSHAEFANGAYLAVDFGTGSDPDSSTVSYTITSNDATAVPVPASAGLALASVCGLGLMRRRRRELV